MSLSEVGKTNIDEDKYLETIPEIIEQCVADGVAWFPHVAENPPFLAMCLAGEVGEVCNILKKIERGTHTYTGETKVKLHEEVVDVFIYLMQLAGALDVDIIDGYNEKRTINESRFDKDKEAQRTQNRPSIETLSNGNVRG